MKATVLALALFCCCILSGCGSDFTARMQGLSLQQKGTIPAPCGNKPADTNTNSMFGPQGAVPER